MNVEQRMNQIVNRLYVKYDDMHPKQREKLIKEYRELEKEDKSKSLNKPRGKIIKKFSFTTRGPQYN
jgi:hypothetical protein